MTRQPTQRPDRAATLAATAAALAADLVVLQRHQQEAVATARAVCHHTQLHRARRRVVDQRRQGRDPGPLAWFTVEGVLEDQVVRAVWADGRLRCDRLLESRARRLVDLGAEFGGEEVPRRYRASLQAPAAAVLLTLIRACDLTTTIEPDLGAGTKPATTARMAREGDRAGTLGWRRAGFLPGPPPSSGHDGHGNRTLSGRLKPPVAQPR